MSDRDDMGTEKERSAVAFEYVAGTLRGHLRAEFEQSLAQDKSLQTLVQFWEEQLMAEHQSTSERAPAHDTWEKIESRLGAGIDSRPSDKPSEMAQWWQHVLTWFGGWKTAGIGFAALWAFTVSLWFVSSSKPVPVAGPNSDYVAVLTDAKERALLTALTSSDGATLWLKWEQETTSNVLFEAETSVQLWAQSRRDGQIRPLAVFENAALASIALNEATLRLIRDSEFLLLTREEEGGSAIDEPSEMVLAKGVCVRLNTTI